MLTRPDGHACYVARCELCGREEYTDEEDFEDAHRVMTLAGWQERARAGKGREKAHWVCVTCKPKPPETMGRSTPGDAPPSSG